METLEKKVSECILQLSSDTIEIEGHEFEIAPPTPATLIMISALVSELPLVDGRAGNIMLEVLSTAKDFTILGRICAVFIIGAKRVKENRKVTVSSVETRRHWSWRKFRKVTEDVTVKTTVPEIDWLADKILHEVTNETLVKVIAKRLGMLQIPDFFALTTSLSEANQLKRTREVVETASGEK